MKRGSMKFGNGLWVMKRGSLGMGFVGLRD